MEPTLKYSVTLALLTVQIVQCTTKTNVLLVEFALTGIESPFSLTKMGAVMDMGAEHLRSKYGNIMNVSRVLFSDPNVTTCAMLERKATFWLARYYYQKVQGNPAIVVFVQECNTVAASVGIFAKEWNIPVFITKMDSYFDSSSWNKKDYPTLTRLPPYHQADLNHFLYKVLDTFDYSNVGILCDVTNDTSGIYVSLCTELFDSLRLTYNISASRFFLNASDQMNTKHYLSEVNAVARVVIIVAHGPGVRQIMLAASDKQMTDGEFVYFAFEFYPSQSRFGNMSWNSGNADKRDQDAREAYRSLFTISLRSDHRLEYDNFAKEIKQLSKEKYGYSYASGEDIDLFAMSYYCAFAIYGQVFDEVVASGRNAADGLAMTRLMWNRTFTVLGSDITISANGHRDASGLTWLLNQMNRTTGIFQPVLEYIPAKKLLRLSRDPVTNSERHIIWVDRNEHPPNEPKCGYRGLKDTPQCRYNFFRFDTPFRW